MGCGAELGAPPRTCSACGAVLPEDSHFCPDCGAAAPEASRFASPLRSLPVSPWVLGGAALAVVVVVAGLLFFVFSGGGGDGEDRVPSGLTFAEPVELSDDAKADLAGALGAMPEPTGETAAEQIHSLLGAPDVFQLWFATDADGGAVRAEIWFYLDYEVSYEFRDGALLFTLPLDDIGELLLIPIRYDPLDFDESTTVEDVQAMLEDPSALIPEETPPDYEFGATVWAGDQLMAAFDEDGELLYVETVPLDIGGGS